MRLCRRFAPTPFRLPIPIFNFGGERGIRTPESLSTLIVFKTIAFNHSAISPYFVSSLRSAMAEPYASLVRARAVRSPFCKLCVAQKWQSHILHLLRARAMRSPFCKLCIDQKWQSHILHLLRARELYYISFATATESKIMAEREGFEPSKAFTLALFESARFNHSRTSPFLGSRHSEVAEPHSSLATRSGRALAFVFPAKSILHLFYHINPKQSETILQNLANGLRYF